MSQPSFLMYKCRSCDQTFEGAHAPDGGIALVIAQGLSAMLPQWRGGPPPAMTEHHDCPDGWTGVADLVGSRPDTDTEEDEDS